MIIKEEKLIKVEGDSFEKFESKINTDKLSKLFGMLSSLYRNVHGSIIREYASNAWDSHKEAKREDQPIIVKLVQEYKDSKLIIKDIGLGMSPQVMRNIYFNYLDSTKETSKDLIGAFGVGSKSALAYTHTFYIDTIFDGILYHYIFSKQSNGIPAGELLFQEETKEHNGTTIIIPVKDEDVHIFHKELKKQLVYFPNVFVQSDYSYINNDYSIYENDLFKYRKDSGLGYLHLSVGNVPYSIDWSELDMSSLEIPLAIKLDIGQVTPTPSRESIIYSESSIKLIKNKIEEVQNFLADSFNKNVEDIETIAQYKEKVGSYSSYIDIELSKDVEISVSRTDIPKVNIVQIKGLEGLLSSKLVSNNPCIDYYNYHKKLGTNGYRKDALTSRHIPSSYYNSSYSEILILKGDLDHTKNLFLAETYNKEFLFIYPKKGNLKRYIEFLNLKSLDKSLWRKAIQKYQELSEEYINSLYRCYDDIQIDSTWISEKEKEKKEKLAEIFLKRKEDKLIVMETPVHGYNNPYVWGKKDRSISNIITDNKYTIYVESKNKEKSMQLYNILSSINLTHRGPSWNVIATAKSYHKYFQKQKHMISYEDFLKSNNKIIIKLATAYKVKETLEKVGKNIKDENFYFLNKNIKDKYEFLEKYYKKYIKYHYGDDYRFIAYISKIVENSGKFDTNVINLLNEVMDYQEGLGVLDKYFSLNSYHYEGEYDYYKYLSLILRHLKKPINKYWYLKEEYNPVYQHFKKEEEKEEEEDE